MPCYWIADTTVWLRQAVSYVGEWQAEGAVSATTFGLVALAEFGDKSQLVCMTLAARHAHWPIWFGALCAFALLNAMAVGLGATARYWMPSEEWIALFVALLFALFGLQRLWAREEDDSDDAVKEIPGHSLFVMTFLMIFLAELGDKTQIAVTGLSATQSLLPVWLGATLALSSTSALGVWAGRSILKKMPPRILRLASGMFFLGFAMLAAGKALFRLEWFQEIQGL